MSHNLCDIVEKNKISIISKKTPNTKFIGCRFDECKFIRTDLRGETDQKFITSKFVNKNEFKDTQGVSKRGWVALVMSHNTF